MFSPSVWPIWGFMFSCQSRFHVFPSWVSCFPVSSRFHVFPCVVIMVSHSSFPSCDPLSCRQARTLCIGYNTKQQSWAQRHPTWSSGSRSIKGFMFSLVGFHVFPFWGFMFSLVGFHVFPLWVSCFPVSSRFHVFPYIAFRPNTTGWAIVSTTPVVLS